jgi:hypothetical protein
MLGFVSFNSLFGRAVILRSVRRAAIVVDRADALGRYVVGVLIDVPRQISASVLRKRESTSIDDDLLRIVVRVPASEPDDWKDAPDAALNPGLIKQHTRAPCERLADGSADLESQALLAQGVVERLDERALEGRGHLFVLIVMLQVSHAAPL